MGQANCFLALHKEEDEKKEEEKNKQQEEEDRIRTALQSYTTIELYSWAKEIVSSKRGGAGEGGERGEGGGQEYAAQGG